MEAMFITHKYLIRMTTDLRYKSISFIYQHYIEVKLKQMLFLRKRLRIEENRCREEISSLVSKLLLMKERNNAYLYANC